jgi:hypothetical protein
MGTGQAAEKSALPAPRIANEENIARFAAARRARGSLRTQASRITSREENRNRHAATQEFCNENVACEARLFYAFTLRIK